MKPCRSVPADSVRAAAVGVSLHTAWVAVVALIGSGDDAELAYRGRLELVTDPMPAQAYHAAAEGGLSLPKATELIRSWLDQASASARAGLPAHPGRQISGGPLLLPGRRSADQFCQRSSAAIWIRLPQVSFSMAMVEPVTLVGGMVNSAPSGFMRSYSRCTSST